MGKKKDLPLKIKDLRQRAEAEIEAIESEEMSPAECVRLIHELRVHQIELEMQNEELRRAQEQLTESRDKYSDLYDFAPVGYLTLNRNGQILEANLAAATLLGVERSRLLGSFLAHFLVEKDRLVFRETMANILQRQQQQQQFHFKGNDGVRRAMLLELQFYREAENHERWRVAMTDITELERAQEELRLHKEDLEELVTERTAELQRSNERLRQVNEELEAVFQASPISIGVFDAEGRVMNINPAAERMFGWSLAELQGKVVPSIPVPEPEESREFLQRALQGETLVGVELERQRRDGSLFPISISVAPLRDPRGEVRGFVALGEDISQRKRAAEALETQVRVLASMVEGVVVTDRHGQIIYTNPAFDLMFGYESGELLGRYCASLNAYPWASNQAIIKDLIREISATGSWHGEFRNRRKDGTTFYTAAHLSALQINGKKFIIAVEEDITERKRAEEALRLSENRFRAFMDNSPAIAWAKDEAGRIVYFNKSYEDQFDIKLQDREGKPDREIWPRKIAEEFRKNDLALLASGEAIKVMKNTVNPDGSLRWWWIIKFPFLGTGGGRYVGGIGVDITERKRAEEALAESEERYRSLFQNNHAIMLLIDPETADIVDANPAACSYYGYAREELTAKKIIDINTLPLKQIRRRMKQACSGEQQQFFFQHRLADGEVRDVEVFSGPIIVQREKAALLHRPRYYGAPAGGRGAAPELSAPGPAGGDGQRAAGQRGAEQVIDNLCLKLLDFLHCEVYLNFLADAEDRSSCI